MLSIISADDRRRTVMAKITAADDVNADRKSKGEYDAPAHQLWWPARKIFGEENADQLISDKLSEQFRRSLQTDFTAIAYPGDERPELQKLYDRGVSLLSNTEATWQDIYEAQQIRTRLIPDDELTAALQRELGQAHHLNMDTAAIAMRLNPGETGGDGLTPAEARTHLVNLVGDVQWERHKRYLRRRLRSSYMMKVCRSTLIVGPIFFLALIWGVMANRDGNTISNFANDFLRYPGLLVAISSGILGAWFSMLVTVDKRLSGLTLEELRVAQNASTLIGRMIFGASAAVIFYFLLRSGLVSATILPNIEQIGFDAISDVDAKKAPSNATAAADANNAADAASTEKPAATIKGYVPSTNLCLLVIWSVLCGFSEKLIPSALNKSADAGFDAENAQAKTT